MESILFPMPSPKTKKNPAKKQKFCFIVFPNDNWGMTKLDVISQCCCVRATDSYEAIKIVSMRTGIPEYPLVATKTNFYEESSDSDSEEANVYERVMGSGSVDEISSESETA